jgi:transketolase
MGLILNGIALEGLTRPYGGTFLVFSDYMRAAVRLAAIQQIPVDLRLDPRLDRPRRGRPDPPADRAHRLAARDPRLRRDAPGGRQRDGSGVARDPAERPSGWVVPVAPGAADAGPQGCRPVATSPGAYVLARRPEWHPDVILDRHGLRGRVAVAAAEQLESRQGRHPGGLDAVPGVVRARRASLPREGPARPRSGPGWRSRPGSRWAGGPGRRRRRVVAIDHFGASADAARCSGSSGSPRQGRRRRQAPSPDRPHGDKED